MLRRGVIIVGLGGSLDLIRLNFALYSHNGNGANELPYARSFTLPPENGVTQRILIVSHSSYLLCYKRLTSSACLNVEMLEPS